MKAIMPLEKTALFLVSQKTKAAYNFPSNGVEAAIFGLRNRGSFSTRPRINNRATFPGAFCLNIPITPQCYEEYSIFAKQT